MKKLMAVLSLAALACSSPAFAQMDMNPLGLQQPKPAHESEGKSSFALGIGAGSMGDVFGSSSGPSYNLVYDYRVSEQFSVGAEVSHATTKYASFYGGHEYGYKFGHNSVGVRGAYHLVDVLDDEHIDLYSGGTLGYNTFSMSAFGPGQQEPLGKTSFMVFGGFAGGRYSFTPSIGVFAEAGYRYAAYQYAYVTGLSYGTVSAGLVVKL